MYRLLFILFCFCLTIAVTAQNSVNDTITIASNSTSKGFNYKPLIIPGVLIGYGIIGIESDQLKGWNSEIKEELNEKGYLVPGLGDAGDRLFNTK